MKGRLTGDALRRAIRYAMGRHRVEQALRKSEERFQLTCLATQDGIWDWDIASGTAWFNEAYQTVYGPAASHLQRHQIPWADQIHPEDRDAVVANLRLVLSQRSTYGQLNIVFAEATAPTPTS